MPRVGLLLAGMIVGSGLVFQAGVNAQLRIFVGSPFRSALINFTVGWIALLTVVVFTSGEAPTARASSWWMWIGGLFGALYVTGSVLLAPRLGATTLAASLVAGQMLAAILLDQFGLLGYRVVPLTLPRVAGIVLLFAGVLLIQRR